MAKPEYLKEPENSKYLMRGFRKKMQEPKFRNEHNARGAAQLNKWRENNENGFKGKKHTAETIRKMQDVKKGRRIGKDNSQYGTCWIYSNELNINKKIHKKDLAQWLKDGYIKGRKI